MELNDEPILPTDALLPSGWEMRPLGTLARIKTGSRDTQDKEEGGAYPFFVRSQTIEAVGSYSMECEAILIPGEGGIGSIFHYVDGRFDYHQRVYGIFDFAAGTNAKYVFYYMVHFFGAEATKNSVKATVDSLRLPTFKEFSIRVPPPAEQRAIAEALSDVDALIAALDALIDKKRAVKTAAMQQLLTGRQRLPGFSGEWKTTTLGEMADVVGGGTPSSSVSEYWDGDVPWCTPTDITASDGLYLDRTARSISEAGLKASSATLLPAGTTLLCTRATVGAARLAPIPMATNQGFQSLVPKTHSDGIFLFYAVQMLQAELVAKASGSTFLEIGKKGVRSIPVLAPDRTEQEAIAAVLSDMDAEIAALEARRDKTAAIKTGMMQELLTGRTRLV